MKKSEFNKKLKESKAKVLEYVIKYNTHELIVDSTTGEVLCTKYKFGNKYLTIEELNSVLDNMTEGVDK